MITVTVIATSLTYETVVDTTYDLRPAAGIDNHLIKYLTSCTHSHTDNCSWFSRLTGPFFHSYS